MATRSNLPSKKYMAGERTELQLRYVWSAGDGGAQDNTGGSTVYIDLAKSLSQLNRRFYRQGLYYYVSSVEFSNGSTAYCEINTAPDTWQTKVAWKRAFNMFMKMNRVAMQGDNILPKYHDFKVALTSAHGTPLDVQYGNIGTSTAYTSDEWATSLFVTADPTLEDTGNYLQRDDADPDSFAVHLVGPHTGSNGNWASIGMIHSLNDVWRRPPAEGIPTLDGDADTDPLANLFDYSDNMDEVRENLNTRNDETPYNHDLMVGASSAEEVVTRAILRTGTGAGSLARAPGFCVPFGLLQVNVNDFGAGTDVGTVELKINMVPGPYHGVYAERVV